MKKTVVVTGAAGYIGGQTVLMLADLGHRVVGIDKTKCPKRLKSVFHDYIEKDFAHKDALYLSDNREEEEEETSTSHESTDEMGKKN